MTSSKRCSNIFLPRSCFKFSGTSGQTDSSVYVQKVHVVPHFTNFIFVATSLALTRQTISSFVFFFFSFRLLLYFYLLLFTFFPKRLAQVHRYKPFIDFQKSLIFRKMTIQRLLLFLFSTILISVCADNMTWSEKQEYCRIGSNDLNTCETCVGKGSVSIGVL